MIDIVTAKCKTNWFDIVAFVFLGFFLALIGFDLDKESYLSLFNTTATIVAALIGFIGIFVVYKLQNILDIRKYYINRISLLKNELKIYKNNILIIQYQPDRINSQLDEVKRIIGELDYRIDSQRADAYHISDRQILKEIEYTLGLILENIDLEKGFSPHKDSFLFAISSILLFSIPIAFNHINFLDDSYVMIFDYWRFVKMPFAGLLFGLFFIVLKDLSNMLKNYFMITM